jgi:hypothetical protein
LKWNGLVDPQGDDWVHSAWLPYTLDGRMARVAPIARLADDVTILSARRITRIDPLVALRMP